MVAFLDDIGKALSFLKKPQSIGSGAYAGTMKMFSNQFDPEDRFKFNNPLAGAIAGAKGDISPTQAVDYVNGAYEPTKSKLAQFVGMGVDVGADPLFIAGPGLSSGIKGLGLVGEGSKLAELGQGFSKIGPIERSAGLAPAARGAQLARRLAVGATAGATSPTELLGSVGVQALGERGLSALAKNEAVSSLLTKFGSKAVEGGAKEAITETAPKSRLSRERLFGAGKQPPATPLDAATPAEAAGEALGTTIREGAVKPTIKDEFSSGGVKEVPGYQASGPGPDVEGTVTKFNAEAEAARQAGVAKLQALKGGSVTTPAAKPDLRVVPDVTTGHVAGDVPSKVPVKTKALHQTIRDTPEVPGVDSGHTSGSTPTTKKPKARAPKNTRIPAVERVLEKSEPLPSPVSTPMPVQGELFRPPPQTVAAAGGPLRTSVVPQVAENPAIPDFLRQKFTQPQLGQSMPPELEKLMNHPGVRQVMMDQSLSADKKLEMILRGLGAI